MSAVNPYAPPAPSSEPIPAKRAFTKSGASILFVALGVANVFPFLARFLVGISVVTTGAAALDDPDFAFIDDIVPKGITSVALTFVPAGVRLLSQEPSDRSKKPPQWLAVGAVVIAILSTIIVWSANVAWYFGHESFGTLAYLSPALRTASVVSILVLVGRLAAIRGRSGLRYWAIVTNVVIIVDYLYEIVDPFGPSFLREYLWANFSFVVLINASVLAILWFARRLENPVVVSPVSLPKRRIKRSRKGS